MWRGQSGTAKRVSGQDVLASLEKILGRDVMAVLKDRMAYLYFGPENLEKIIESRPDQFERAMREIFGRAGPILIRLAFDSKT